MEKNNENIIINRPLKGQFKFDELEEQNEEDPHNDIKSLKLNTDGEEDERRRKEVSDKERRSRNKDKLKINNELTDHQDD